MKLWQLFSIAREQPDVIEEAARRKPSWKRYLDASKSFDDLVREQRRDILDSAVDEEFTQQVTSTLRRKLYLSGQQLCSRRRGMLDRELRVDEAVRRFGGEAVEDAFEYGSVDVNLSPD